MDIVLGETNLASKTKLPNKFDVPSTLLMNSSFPETTVVVDVENSVPSKDTSSDTLKKSVFDETKDDEINFEEEMLIEEEMLLEMESTDDINT